MADSDFKEIQDYTGPKRVKTKEVEVEAHNPIEIQKLKERRSSKPTLLSQFAWTRARPKHDCYCRKTDEDTEC
jgi:hypothetical protein